jgi:hypothetical protein
MSQKLFKTPRILRGWICVRFIAIVLLLLGFTLHCSAQKWVETPRPKAPAESGKKVFWILTSAVYAASLADMHQWISIRNKGNEEVDPLAKPFARLPAPAYYAGGLALATGANFLSYKMSKSPRWHKYRRIPQLISIGGNTFGYLSSYYHSNR